MSEKSAPAWVAEWLAKRVEKEEKKIAKQNEPAAPPDPEAEAKAAVAAEKRALAREAKVTSGLQELGIWLDDLVRTGFATLSGKPSSFWETPAQRLIDAQAPGLARRVRELDGITTTGQTWPEQLLREAALLHLAREAWPRIESLPELTRLDLRTAIGFPISQEEVLAQPALRDRWFVLGQRVEEEDRLRVQRSWLFGQQSRRFLLSLSFSAGPNQPLDITLVPGSCFEAECVFFPGAAELRGLVKQRFASFTDRPPEFIHNDFASANSFAAEMFSANPWIERVPLALSGLIPVRRGAGWVVCDEHGSMLPLKVQEAKGWALLALSGGRPLSIAGEFDGESLLPLSVYAGERFLPL